jgi:phosphopantothenoylcysteine decarboxylase / phosphopantothenate---cysteine ligase
MKPLRNAGAPRVLLGVCGGIAAYKAVELVRALQRQGMEVRVSMTRAAQEFVQPLTFATLTGHTVYLNLWQGNEQGSIEHIAQAQWADVLLIAPATAHTLARLSHGLADDFLAAAYLATQGRVVLAPAMNVNMWNHAATRANLQILKERGHRIVDPESGELACGMTGDGRLAEAETIVQAVLDCLQPLRDLEGETVLITAGGTREAVDPVRYLGNRSSGRMGFAMAAAAERRGARVIVVAASVSIDAPARCEIVRVETAHQMHTAVLERLPEATMVIKAAAVADFRPRDVAASKLHRDGALTLELEPTEDIVRSVVEHRRAGTLVIAFAAEMGLDLARAREKLQRKGVDAIVVNDISRAGIGFDSERNAAVFLIASGIVEIPEASKNEVAGRILDEAVAMRLRTWAAMYEGSTTR